MIRGNPKPDRIMGKVRRHLKRRDTKAAEDAIMRQVRREDRYCRFPECGCGKMKLGLDVAHLEHRGMGGNPKLDRTTPAGLILLCRARHRAHKFALDKKTIRCEPLTDMGSRGPVRWEIPLREACELLNENDLKNCQLDYDDVDRFSWMVLAVEQSRHVFEAFTPAQSAILRHLSTMTC